MELTSISLNDELYSVDYRTKINNAFQLLNEVESDLNQETESELIEEMRRVDLMVQDLLHIIEFMDFNASQGYNFCKMLKVARQARRKIKDRMEERKTVRNLMKSFSESGFKNQVKQISSNLNALPERRESRTYRLRELSELEGFLEIIDRQKEKMKKVS